MIQYKEMFQKNLLYCLLPSSRQFDETLERKSIDELILKKLETCRMWLILLIQAANSKSFFTYAW